MRAALATLGAAMLLLVGMCRAWATDFYELQIYTVETAPQGHLLVEVHSNDLTSATGQEARRALPVYQYHNTIEATYGVLPYLEVGQYLCTGRLNSDTYEYAGARSKVHFGIPATESWPVAFGANLEFDYMRRAAVSDPLALEVMPIAEARLGRFTIIGNLTFEKQFSGPGTHQGIGFEPVGALDYRLLEWLEPSVEYFGDIGAIATPLGLAGQQQFIVPAVNLYLLPQLEFNVGVGFGLTRASNGTFIASTIGWQF